MAHPVTPDRRYFVVRGRLWRCSDPALPDAERTRLTRELMQARSAVGRALRTGDVAAEREARARVHAAKCALGERGTPWWTDGAPDYNRRLARNTPYAAWFAGLADADDEREPASKAAHRRDGGRAATQRRDARSAKSSSDAQADIDRHGRGSAA